MVSNMSGRLVCWWSAGAASACAAALALRAWDGPKVVAYCASVEKSEHPDNARMLADCERWYGQSIERLYSDKYTDTWDVWARTRWLVGPAGARCTTELKKLVRRAFQQDGDTQVFGFTAEEVDRAANFEANNPEVSCWFPLIERGLRHDDCEALLSAQQIALPAMYLLGYRNNNCIGCVKGGAGYWNKIRVDFPAVFSRMAALERELDVSILRRVVAGQHERLFLDRLPPTMGRYKSEPAVECGVACEAARVEVGGGG